MQGGNQIVVFLPVLIVQKHFLGGALLEGVLGHRNALAPVRLRVVVSVENQHFQSGQRRPGIASGEHSNGPQHFIGDDDILVPVASRIPDGPFQQTHHLFFLQGLQYEYLAAGQQRPVHLKGRILRGGADENDTALFHKGQEGILLRLVKAMNLVDKNDGSLAESPALLRLLHHLADFLNSAGHRTEGDEPGLGGVGDYFCQGSLSHPRRPPENHGGHLVVGN